MVRINGLFHLPINRVHWGSNPLTNHLLTSWENPKWLTTGMPGIFQPVATPRNLKNRMFFLDICMWVSMWKKFPRCMLYAKNRTGGIRTGF